jgi:toxin ParE1/3/4
MKVVILASAEHDLRELRRYIVGNFSHETWRKTYSKLKESIRNLAKFPLLGSIPAELETMNITQYRQIISGMNRIVYEQRTDVVYIYMIVDTRRDLSSLLMQRLMR